MSNFSFLTKCLKYYLSFVFNNMLFYDIKKHPNNLKVD